MRVGEYCVIGDRRVSHGPNPTRTWFSKKEEAEAYCNELFVNSKCEGRMFVVEVKTVVTKPSARTAWYRLNWQRISRGEKGT